MRCGEKCFIVTYERNHQIEEVEIQARSAIQARKKLRSSNLDIELKIISVRDKLGYGQ